MVSFNLELLLPEILVAGERSFQWVELVAALVVFAAFAYRMFETESPGTLFRPIDVYLVLETEGSGLPHLGVQEGICHKIRLLNRAYRSSGTNPMVGAREFESLWADLHRTSGSSRGVDRFMDDVKRARKQRIWAND